jgi:hypothetical protein
VTKVHIGWGCLTGNLAKHLPLSYSQITHPVLGLIGSQTLRRDPEAGTAVINFGGLMELEGPEVLFVPGTDGIGQPYLDRALPAAE